MISMRVTAQKPGGLLTPRRKNVRLFGTECQVFCQVIGHRHFFLKFAKSVFVITYRNRKISELETRRLHPPCLQGIA